MAEEPGSFRVGFVEFDVDGGARTCRVPHPSCEEILARVRQLDGVNSTLLTIGVDDMIPPWLQVGGGDGGFFMCQYMRDTLDDFLMLTDLSQSERQHLTLTVGGQSHDKWSRQVAHPLPVIEQCVRHFFDHLAVHPSFCWIAPDLTRVGSCGESPRTSTHASEGAGPTTMDLQRAPIETA